RSGLFAPIDPVGLVERIGNMDSPNLKSWAATNVQFLLTGRVTRLAEGGLRAEFRLWNVASGQEVRNKGCDTAPNNWRRIAHIISDQVYEQAFGEKGYFDSRIAFVDESGSSEQRT